MKRQTQDARREAQERDSTDRPVDIVLSVSEIAAAIEDDIIFGRLRPFQELAEDRLIERFGAKRHAIRSALDALTRRGVVVKPPHKSARVRDYTHEEVSEIYHMRTLLQREAAFIMELPGSREQVSELQRIQDEYVVKVQDRSNLRRIHKLNDTFHSTLFDACGNRYLADAIRNFTYLSNPIRSYGISDVAWLETAALEHQAMIDCIGSGDRQRLARLVVEHMYPTRDRWLALNTSN